jgi:hypothetical protein
VSPGPVGLWVVALVFTSLTAMGMIYATAAATAQQLISPLGMLGWMNGSNRFLQAGLLPLGPLGAGGLDRPAAHADPLCRGHPVWPPHPPCLAPTHDARGQVEAGCGGVTRER